jgi:hypothetical protein
MRAFVKLRELLASNEELNRKFTAVIRKLATHDKYFTVVFDELKKLNEPPTPSRKQIGFKTASWVAPTLFYAACPLLALSHQEREHIRCANESVEVASRAH